jgi:hypothetical protein
VVIVQLLDRKSGVALWQGEANLDPKDQDATGEPRSPETTMHRLLQPLPTRP